MQEPVVGIAERVLRQNWLEGERDGTAFAYTRPEPRPLPLAVVLGLLLRGDRLAPLRPVRGAAPSSRACWPPSAPTASSATRSSGTGRSRCCRLPFYNVASRRRIPDRDDPAAAAGLGLADRRRRPGRGAADRRPGRLAGAPTATSRATGCSGSSSPTSPGSTPRRSSTRSGAGAPTAGSASRCWSAATAGSASTRGGSATPAARSSARSLVNTLLVALAAGAGPALGDAGAGRAALGRAPRALPRRGAARRRCGRGSLTWASLAPLALPDLPEEIGRRLVEEHLLDRARVPRPPVAPPSVAASRAELRTRRRPRPDPPLLARPDLGQLGLDGLARPAPPRLRDGGGSGWPTA